MIRRTYAMWLVLMAVLALPASAKETVEYIHTDALGSVVAVTDSKRNVIERREYEPYGAQTQPLPAQNGPGYTGHVFDTATGLMYMQQRYYDPVVGKFLSPDPVAVDTGTTWNFNRYAYANNNPYKFTDPDGRQSELAQTPNTGTPFFDWLIGGESRGSTKQMIEKQFAAELSQEHSAEDIALYAGIAMSAGTFARGRGFSKGVRYGPTNPGPLDDAVAATFRSGSYTATTVSETTTLYRVYGGSAGKLGRYWTRTKPSGPLQSQLDSALAPQWENSAQNVVSIRVPNGTTIYEGAAAPQSTGVGEILGGGNQVYIPRVDPKWIQ